VRRSARQVLEEAEEADEAEEPVALA
jgi:hypothetical protein